MSINPIQISSDDYVSENRSGVGGGISDVYGEDSATLDQLVTPWVTSVARCLILDSSVSMGLIYLFKLANQEMLFLLCKERDSFCDNWVKDFSFCYDFTVGIL